MLEKVGRVFLWEMGWGVRGEMWERRVRKRSPLKMQLVAGLEPNWPSSSRLLMQLSISF